MTERTAYARGEATSALPRRVATSELRQHSTAILHAAGLALDVAELVADSLVDAEVRGIGSHGVTRTRIYSERLRAGMIDASAQPEIEQSSPGRIQVNAKNAIGHLGARTGIDAAVEMAAENFVGVAGVADSNHCGTLAYFARRAAERGFLAIAMSTAPPTMIYFGGRTRAVGTNPIAFAVPRPDGPPIVVDMATSATARGKIILSNRLGKDIPPGWAVDAEGKPTTDAAAALLGSVVPFGGPKGSGLAMMIDLFAGALVGGLSGPDIGDMYEDYTRPQHVSHLFLVLNPDGWVGKEAFDEHVAEFVKRVRTLPPADGVDRILLPGELEHGRWEEAERNGAVLESIVFDDLNDIAAELGIDRRVTAMDGWES